KPYHIFERDGVKIGVIGLVQIGANGLPDIHPDHGKGLKFSDPFKVMRDYAYLRAKCDVLILLTHLGFEDDLKLAKLFPEADAIIGGHTHTRVEKEVRENGVLVTQTENKVKYITRLSFEVEDGKVLSKKSELISLKNYAKDADIQKAVDETKASPYMQRRLGSIKPAITRRESLGCLMADALRAYAKTDVAIVNFGNVRLEEFPEGDFIVADCYRLDPFCNQTVIFKATGKELVNFLNNIPASDHHGAPCVSGIRYKAIKPAAELQPMRITEITLPDGTPVDPDKYYTVATNSYLMSTVTPQPADSGVAHDMDGARAIMLYMEGKEAVDYSNISNIEVTIE
ncbi:MAG: 5'-nucleotidase C-terminal domain-containing protein, partial [Clostridia bacterium]|nr:5'-nucleotidase C-terminal domain-containing protein [Clostridia bacterium]